MLQEKIRYLDVEFDEFCMLINEKLKEVYEDYDFLKGLFFLSDNYGMDDIGCMFNMMEDGFEIFLREEVVQLVFCQEKFIENLKNVFLCIENKIYGICCVIGKLIVKECFCLVFYVIFSIEVKNM